MFRSFAEFVTQHPFALQLYNWFLDFQLPEESYYATLASITVLDNDILLQDLDTDFSFGKVRLHFIL